MSDIGVSAWRLPFLWFSRKTSPFAGSRIKKTTAFNQSHSTLEPREHRTGNMPMDSFSETFHRRVVPFAVFLSLAGSFWCNCHCSSGFRWFSSGFRSLSSGRVVSLGFPTSASRPLKATPWGPRWPEAPRIRLSDSVAFLGFWTLGRKNLQPWVSKKKKKKKRTFPSIFWLSFWLPFK